MQSISEFMRKDHNRLDELFKRYNVFKNSDPIKAKEIFFEFKYGLQKHILWEEEILFPLFENKTGMSYIEPTFVLKIEHEKIKHYLAEMSIKLENSNNQTDDFENILNNILFAHNYKEENIIYSMIDDFVNAEELSELFLKMKGL